VTSSRPRDVFIVANNIEELGGAIRFAHTLGRLLSGEGHRVHLVGIVHPHDVFDYGTDLPYQTHVLHERHPPRAADPKGLSRLDPRGHLRRAVRHRMQRAGAQRLSRLLRQAQPGGVVIVTQIFAMEWVRLADTEGLHVIGMSHESFAASKASTRYARVLRYYRDADRLLLLTQADADDWAAAGLSNVGVMPNPLGVTARVLSSVQDNVVVSLGRFSWEKGFDLLLDAWAQVVERFPDWSLDLYGDGPDEDTLRRRCEQLGLASVNFRGRTTDVPGVLTRASIYALASRHEGMPVVLTEALEFGVPCVAFDVSPGVREVLTHEMDGLVVPPGNTSRFADALAVLMTDASLRQRYGAHGHDSMRRFAPERVVERWEREFRLLDL
jgi:glycosyltransferase involved in cell wall biosynthesis